MWLHGPNVINDHSFFICGVINTISLSLGNRMMHYAPHYLKTFRNINGIILSSAKKRPRERQLALKVWQNFWFNTSWTQNKSHTTYTIGFILVLVITSALTIEI
jgi:hypothetical protein